MRTAKTFYMFCLVALISVSLSTFAFSQVPQKINYSGIITDSLGNPLPDGNYDVEFKLYDVSSGGSALWSEIWNSSTTQVTTFQGIFNVTLGSHTLVPSTFFNEHPVTYLGVKVGTDSEMTPRQQFTSVAYAFTSGDGTPQGGIIMWSGSIAAIPSGWALCDGTNGTPDLRDRFVVGAGLGYGVGNTGGNNSINLQHSHTVGSHVHTTAGHVLTINEMPSHTHVQNKHTHTFEVRSSAGSGGGKLAAATNGGGGTGGYGQFDGGTAAINQNTGGGAAHNHGNTGASSPGTDNQLSASQSILPPYYALAFIMKL